MRQNVAAKIFATKQLQLQMHSLWVSQSAKLLFFATLGEYLDKANACPTDEERLYLSEQSTDKIMPEVIDDYIPPPYINTSKFSAAFILVAICTLKYIFIHLEKRCFALFLGEKN